MTRPIILFAAISLTVLSSDAAAVKQVVHVSPNESTFKVEPAGEHMVRFVITRDPALTNQPNHNSLVIVRSARLRVTDGDATIVSAPVAPQTNNRGLLVYSFVVHEKYVPNTRFTLSELEDTANRTGYMGGGTIYEFSTGSHPLLQDSLDAALKAVKNSKPMENSGR